jgi:hypothetical protein
MLGADSIIDNGVRMNCLDSAVRMAELNYDNIGII